MLSTLCLALLLAGCGGGAATSGSPGAQAPAPVVEDAWVRTTEGAKDTSMTAAFLTIWLVSLLDKSAQAKKERDYFPAQQVRSETGLGAAGASGH